MRILRLSVFLLLLFNFQYSSLQAFYPSSSFVPSNVWEQLKPHFLPEDHELKSALDTIFSKHRVTENKSKLKKAGFTILSKGEWSRALVVKHKKLKGYVLKIYLDTEPKIKDWERWIDRIGGVAALKKAIQSYRFERFFEVPKKWVYPLPDFPSPSFDTNRKGFILIAEEISLDKSSEKKWKSKKITHELLDALYTILSTQGMCDCVYSFNLPFSKNGKVAFIDTEYHHCWPVHYEKFTQSLSKSLQPYWKMLIQNGGPP